MLEQILTHVNNWFVVGIYDGEFTVEDGSITLPFLQDGQYFRVIGSVFNDGLHKYPTENLLDETFCGTVWALAIPPAVLSLSEDVQKWQEKHGDAVLSPYTSESFGGYAYTKASAGKPGTVGVAGWQDAFRSRLNDFRKLKGGSP